MAEQQKKKVERPKGDGDGDGAAANPEVSKKGKKIKEDLDKLLDEIDDILEENAEEFVKSYVQRGGRVDRCRSTSTGASHAVGRSSAS